jgi:hypothetical protein
MRSVGVSRQIAQLEREIDPKLSRGFNLAPGRRALDQFIELLVFFWSHLLFERILP